MDFRIERNDISNMEVGAIVLPANKALREGSGTSKAIFEKAGRTQLNAACKKYKAVHVGDVLPTLGYATHAKYIFHAVVPKWKNGKKRECELLSQAYFAALSLADTMECESLALPLLCAGNNGFDFETAFQIARYSIKEYQPRKNLKDVILVVYDPITVNNVENAGYEIDRVIDDVYTLQKDEAYVSSLQSVANKGLVKARLFYADNRDAMNEAAKAAVRCGLEWVKEPDNQKKLLNLVTNVCTK